jgi:hypothetical protein
LLNKFQLFFSFFISVVNECQRCCIWFVAGLKQLI